MCLVRKIKLGGRIRLAFKRGQGEADKEMLQVQALCRVRRSQPGFDEAS